MLTALKIGSLLALLCAVPVAAQAGRVEGAGIGAGAGAVVAGPVGAVVGGVIGYNVGGPDIVTPKRHRSCWRDDHGRRHCTWHRY